MAGIDVSAWQIAIDWKRVASQFNFAYIRAGIGATGSDKMYADWTESALETDLKVGHYHLFRPDGDGFRQAENAIRLTKMYKTKLVPAIDFEIIGDPLNTAIELVHMVLALQEYFCAKPVIYTAKGVWSRLDDRWDEFFAQYPLWVANYGVSKPNLPRAWKDYAIWQYTSGGRVSGIASKRVDLNHEGPQFKSSLL